MSTQSVSNQTGTTGAWRSLLVKAAWLQIIINVVVIALSGEIIPPLVAVAVLLVVGLALIGGRTKVGAAILGIVSLLHLATSAPFVIGNLSHPDSFFDFFLGWALIVSALLGTAASVPVWRGTDSEGGRARPVLVSSVLLLVILAAVGAVATLTTKSVAADEGDVTVTAEDVEFDPADLEAQSGEVGIHVDNKDQLRHTFTIDELEVSLELPAGKGARTSFTAEPGEYAFYCAVPGHEDMKGTLTVQ
jgi:plastocyanin